MVDELIKTLKEDKGFYDSWKANIAMAMVDAYRNAEKGEGIKEIANDGAEAFLKLLMGEPYPYFIS